MEYADLTDEEAIHLAVECVGRGIEVPRQVVSRLGADLMHDIMNPGDTHEP